MNIRSGFCALLLSILLFNLLPDTLAHAQTDVYLRIYEKTFQRMEVDLYPFEGQNRGAGQDVMAATITEVLSNDLWMSGYFKVNVKFGTPEPRTGGGQNGRSGGPLAWIAGKFRIQDGRLAIQPDLVDAASGRTIIKSEYFEQENNARRAVHKIADDIVYSLTGEEGIASTRVAFVKEGRNGHKEIGVMDYDGKNARTLTNDKSINLSPAWSPDGEKLAFTSFKDENPNLYLLNLRNSTQYRLSDGKGLNSAPAWSPDGKRLALTLSKDGNAELYIMDVERKKFRRLTYNRAIDSSPSWSPSNREIVFTSDRTGSPQVYIMDTDGLNVRRLTYAGSYNDSPNWSPRGDKIAYVSRTASGFDIYTIDVTGEKNMRLTDSSNANEDPCWSANGFSLIFSSNRSGRRELYSMFWDGSDQKKLTSGGGVYLPAWSPRQR